MEVEQNRWIQTVFVFHCCCNKWAHLVASDNTHWVCSSGSEVLAQKSSTGLSTQGLLRLKSWSSQPSSYLVTLRLTLLPNSLQVVDKTEFLAVVGLWLLFPWHMTPFIFKPMIVHQIFLMLGISNVLSAAFICFLPHNISIGMTSEVKGHGHQNSAYHRSLLKR